MSAGASLHLAVVPGHEWITELGLEGGCAGGGLLLWGAGPEQSRDWPHAGVSGLMIDSGKGQIHEGCPRGRLTGKTLSLHSRALSLLSHLISYLSMWFPNFD